jgi:CCR4-NOT transcription complex subunit 2
MKLNQSTHAAWNSTNPAPSSQSQLVTGAFATSSTATQLNGTHPNHTQTQTQPSTQQHLNAPPGVPLPGGSYVTSSHNAPATVTTAGAGSAPTPYTSNGLAQGDVHASSANANHNIPSNAHNQLHATNHPQTPAQQVLMSAADRWGLLGLLAMIQNAGSDADQGLISVGTDLGTMGLDMGYPG